MHLISRCFFQRLVYSFITKTEGLAHFIVFENWGNYNTLKMALIHVTKHGLYLFALKGEKGKKGIRKV